MLVSNEMGIIRVLDLRCTFRLNYICKLMMLTISKVPIFLIENSNKFLNV